MLASATLTRGFGRRGRPGVTRVHWPRPGWRSLGVVALLCSTVAWASLPRLTSGSTDEQVQWRALGVSPLASRGASGLAMAPTDAAAPIAFAPVRAIAFQPIVAAQPVAAPVQTGPLR